MSLAEETEIALRHPQSGYYTQENTHDDVSIVCELRVADADPRHELPVVGE